MFRCAVTITILIMLTLSSQPAVARKTTFGQHQGWEVVEVKSDAFASGCFVQRQSSRQSSDFSGYGSLSTWLKYNYDRKRIEFFSHDAPFLSEATYMIVGEKRFSLRIDRLGGWIDDVDNQTVFEEFPKVSTIRVVFGDHWIEFDTLGLEAAVQDAKTHCPYG